MFFITKTKKNKSKKISLSTSYIENYKNGHLAAGLRMFWINVNVLNQMFWIMFFFEKHDFPLLKGPAEKKEVRLFLNETQANCGGLWFRIFWAYACKHHVRPETRRFKARVWGTLARTRCFKTRCLKHPVWNIFYISRGSFIGSERASGRGRPFDVFPSKKAPFAAKKNVFLGC